MRENRLYGSEGGAGVLSLRSYPYRALSENLRSRRTTSTVAAHPTARQSTPTPK